MLHPHEADHQMGLWSHRLEPEYFSLLGGEPTLNPDLSEIVRIARRHWPRSKLQMVTNGFLLGRHPELPGVLEETGGRLEISVHHGSEEYQAKLQPVRELVDAWKRKYRFYVHWRDSNTRWTRTYQGEGPSMRPYEHNRPRVSWEHCRSRWCPQIHEGKLWKCPQLAYLRMQLEKQGIANESAWQPYLNYQPLEPHCSDEELREFVSREDESVCSMCTAEPELFDLPLPLRTAGSSANAVS